MAGPPPGPEAVRATTVYVVSYGFRHLIQQHLLIAGLHVPTEHIITPGSVPPYSDGFDMGDGKTMLLQYIQSRHPTAVLFLVDDSNVNVTKTQQQGRLALKVCLADSPVPAAAQSWPGEAQGFA